METANYHLLDTLTLSSITGIGVSTLKQWRGQKKGPSYLKIGNKVMYRSDTIERWLDQSAVGTVDMEVMDEKA